VEASSIDFGATRTCELVAIHASAAQHDRNRGDDFADRLRASPLEAKSKEFFRVARLAREALDGKPAVPTPAK
jgi:hypothetical protein